MTTTWARARSVAAAVLARIWPPSGAHHAMPGHTEAPAAVEPSRPPLAAAVSPAMTTMLDLRAIRSRPFVPHQRGGQHRG